MYYAITPRHIPTEKIVASVEQSITNLPTDCKDELRADICSILKKNAKTPATSNITREEREAVKELKRDDRIIFLPADKGNATVVLNKPDYNEQVTAILQDTKTYAPITDRRRNPTSSTATTLQKKLLSLKKSGNITDAEYNKLKPNDPVPAAFYGLPKVRKV